MKLYELTYIPSSDLSDEEQKKLLERVVSFLQTSPIEQRLFTSLVSLDFYTEPEKIEALEKNLKAEPQIKKYMLVKRIIHKVRVKNSRKAADSVKTEKKTKKPRVELKEIEKKLDEILKET